MGLFSKKPNSMQRYQIQVAIEESQRKYKEIVSTNRIDHFFMFYDELNSNMEFLLNAEKKFPSYFGKNRPSTNWDKINKERSEVEQDFVKRFITSIEKKLLKYSTDRGKSNNFNKEVDSFMYYAENFLPDTVDYFNKMINERFPEYMK